MNEKGKAKPKAGGKRGTHRQRILAEEVASQRETLLQACWAHHLWKRPHLATEDGSALEVLSPGWLNRTAGPDFTEARILIAGREHWGDVEIHVEEKEWWEHGHHKDPGYDRVILHVVLKRGPKAACRPVSHEEIPVFAAGPFLSEQVLESMHDPEELLRRYENIPGRCGLRAAFSREDAVGRVVAHAAERRARDKALRVVPLLEEAGEEEAFFRLLFRYLGYRPHAEQFEGLARRFPLRELMPLLGEDLQLARTEVLGRWFGALGLLQEESPAMGGTDPAEPESSMAGEYARLKAVWDTLDMQPIVQGISRGGGRPWNSPERRLVGMFHHLYAMGRRGWLQAWLAFLRRLDDLRDQPEFRKEALLALEAFFLTPDWESWRRRVSFQVREMERSARLIGSERTVMLMANAVLPYFLAVARSQGDLELERVLYRLYIVLPPEGPNRRTRFMEKRLAGLTRLKKSLRTQQGLLQIHQDFCTSFYEGCDRCGFPDLIAPQSVGGC